MSRVLFVDLHEDVVIRECSAQKVGISAIERLPSGGVRFVCMGSDGASTMRRKLKKHLLDDEVVRAAHRPATPLW